MVRTQNTEWPIGREPKPMNTIRKGGLYHKQEQDRLVAEANRIIQPPRKVKDQVKIFAVWFWIIFALGTVITFFILNRH